MPNESRELSEFWSRAVRGKLTAISRVYPEILFTGRSGAERVGSVVFFHLLSQMMEA